MSIKDLIIIDDFYDDPYLIRSLALNTEYNIFEKTQNFPGAESKKAYYLSTHVKTFENLLDKKIKIDPGKYIFGKFRYSLKNDKSNTTVHLDWPVDWTAIIYLTLDKDCRGGLGFYKHLELDTCIVDEQVLQKYNCKNIFEFDRKYIKPQSNDLSKWELIEEIPMKFNRLVLFKGSKYFHAITQQFGNSITNSRLTQNFFFHEA